MQLRQSLKMLPTIAVIIATVLSAALGFPHISVEIHSSPSGRIVGGQTTRIENHPYIVSVQVYGAHYCGGSIISATWVITAAHCIVREVPDYSIRAGSSLRNYGGQVIPANRIIIHEKYLRETLDYDIAVIQLKRPITIPVARAIVMAPEGGYPSVGTTGIVTGWGALYEGGPMATNLKVVYVPVISQTNCRAIYGQTVITERKFCAGFLGIGERDACQGDSGGPFIANGVLTGVISWGRGCARFDAPGVYASIPSLRTWIKKHTAI